MAAPVIANSAALAIDLGAAFAYRIPAPGATSWGASGLPDGIVLDTVTGEMSGRPTSIGEYLTTLTATNGDGDSEPVQLAIGVIAPSADVASMDLLLDFDIATRRVKRHGGEFGEPIFLGCSNDQVRCAVGLVDEAGVLQPVGPSAILLSVQEAIGDPAVDLNTGTEITTVGVGAGTRYRIIADLANTTLAGIVDGQEVLLPAQIEVRYPDASESDAADVSASVTMTLTTHDTNYTEDLVLLNVARAGTYTLTISATLAGYTGISYVINLRLEAAGSGLAVASVSGEYFDSATNSGTVLVVSSNPLATSITWSGGNLVASIISASLGFAPGAPLAPVITGLLEAVSVTPVQLPLTSRRWQALIEGDISSAS